MLTSTLDVMARNSLTADDVAYLVELPGEDIQVLPSVLINGRNMHYAYERGSMPREKGRDSATHALKIHLKNMNVSTSCILFFSVTMLISS